MTYPKKLIEVALPLEDINAASAREKNIRQGHPSTLHLWWARRPLAAARAVIFSQLVDDPSEHPERFPTVAEQDAERQRLFGQQGRGHQRQTGVLGPRNRNLSRQRTAAFDHNRIHP